MISKTRVNNYFENIMKLRNQNLTSASGRKKDLLSPSINNYQIVNFLELHLSQLQHLLLQLHGPITTSTLNNFLSVNPFLKAKLFLKEDLTSSTKEGLFKTKECNLIKPKIECKMKLIEWFISLVTIQASTVKKISKVNFKKYI